MSDTTTTAQASSDGGGEAIVDQGVAEIAGASEAAVEDSGEITEELEASEEGQEEVLEATGESEGEEAIEEEIKELKKKLKLKVDGQEIEEELDWNDEESLVREMQKAKAFDKKAQESAQLRKDMQGLLGALQENPAAVLEQLGMDVDDFAAKRLESKIEELSKSPEQLAQEQMQKELEELREEKKRLSSERETALQEQMRDQEATRIENSIVSALENHDGLLSTEDPSVIGDIGRAMLRAMSAGVKDVTPEQVIPLVEKQYAEKLQKRLGSLSKRDIKLVEKLLGKDIFEEARKRRVSKKRKAKTETANQVAKQTGQNSKNTQTEQPEGEKLSYGDFFKPY